MSPLLRPLFAVLLAGCASTPAAETKPAMPATASNRPVCDEIATLCHPHAEHGGVMSTCHQMGHDPASTNEMCQAKKSECQAACNGGHAH